MMEILVVDDERGIREGLKALLSGEGFAVRTARDGNDALSKFAERRPDLILLDVMMPKLNGFSCCEELRKLDARVPILFLTAKDGDADQLRALGLGADDFISKSAAEAVLLARIRRTLDRQRQAAARPADSEQIQIGTATVDLRRLTVSVDHREIALLTRTEADLLKILWTHPGEKLTIDKLIAELRGVGFACTDNMLYVHMSHVRQKLGAAGERITTLRGAGYCLNP